MSNNKTVARKTGPVAKTLLVLAAAVLAALAFQPSLVSAQEEREERLQSKSDRLEEARSRTGFHSAKGAGVAIDQETGDRFRTGFIFLIHQVNGTENEFEVRRGVIGQSVDDERVYYTSVPETWTIVLSEDGLSFRAAGKVEKGDETFEVTLNGYFAMHTRLGNLWSVQGEMEGRENQYDLRYVGISHVLRTAAVDEAQ
jgi:hypothetical protein